MRPDYERVTGLSEGMRRAGNLSARTVIFDVEPLVAPWDSDQESLDRGMAAVLSEVTVTPGIQVVCFATNSPRRPSWVPEAPRVRVVYLALAGKPLRTAAYRGFPRPGVVIGDQVATDGLLARRLGYGFVLYAPHAAVPAGPRLLSACGRLVLPMLFTRAH